MHAVLEPSDRLLVLHLRAVHHSVHPATQCLLVLVVLSGLYFERWAKGFKVEGGFDELFFWDFVDDGDEVLDEVVIKDVFGLELGEAFAHDRSPFLNEREVYRRGDETHLSIPRNPLGPHAFPNDGHLLVKVHPCYSRLIYYA